MDMWHKLPELSSMTLTTLWPRSVNYLYGGPWLLNHILQPCDLICWQFLVHCHRTTLIYVHGKINGNFMWKFLVKWIDVVGDGIYDYFSRHGQMRTILLTFYSNPLLMLLLSTAFCKLVVIQPSVLIPSLPCIHFSPMCLWTNEQ